VCNDLRHVMFHWKSLRQTLEGLGYVLFVLLRFVYFSCFVLLED